MTQLTKTVRRETSILSPEVHPRPIVIEIDPPGLITFREKGRRRRTTATISWLYQKAMEKEAAVRLAEGKRRTK
jgi:hypothetical protein